MHYYKRNIGDYHKKAGRLTMLQHGAYTLLMDACYDREKFPTLDEAIEWLWASSDDEISAIKFVLNKFFSEDSGIFTQGRIAAELESYAEKAETNKRIAIEREQKRRLNSTNRARTVDEPTTKRHLTTNQEPLTTNQEPLTTNQEPLTTNQELLTTNQELLTTNQELLTNKKTVRFSPPTHQDALQYFIEQGVNDSNEATKFVDFYEMKGWMVGKNKMKDWKAAVRNWLKNYKPTVQQQERKKPRGFGQ